ncbi:mannitol dehydrogenase family protein [Cellulomonas shaoxiangyii]|uniref:Mannitol dehydrogenase family protein n=1 Tax=Cellulomonas shaoxiangyii TaxID=2566013 RepID=A0A4V1CMT1_9CELL|nr:mannitol dehydrogenase family protein [Cellulomonas shaoxiangyii]QCB94025.1 mannitol dehydrogenase family protein [Cellulomonas shaoxiangyii]TGY85786.1 mannitol dehydrogenase family protein [Cellulomonas shaoxiangyii]
MRIVHLGLGNFARAHQFWYTEHAPDAGDWGVAAFTGRRPDAADQLRGQDGLYSLITRGEDREDIEVVSAISALHASAEHDAFLAHLAHPDVRVVTTTVTEAGYLRGADGGLHLGDAAVAADLAAVSHDRGAAARTVPVRLAAGLDARRRAGAGSLTVVPCDNLSHNGAVLARVVLDAAEHIDPALAEWIGGSVSWVTSMVDRITPATTDQDRADVAAARGYVDASPVSTEPFSEWVLAGAFPGGRPDWEAAGALVVDDVAPFEERKLRMLNGAHSLMAYGASVRGHRTVAEAIADPVVRSWVEEWWAATARHLTVPTDDYRAALLERFSNARIQHLLAQIAADGSQKLPVRVIPVVRAELEARSAGADGALRPVAAWVQHLRGHGAPVQDAGLPESLVTPASDLEDAVTTVLRHLAPDLAAERAVVDRVTTLAREIA